MKALGWMGLALLIFLGSLTLASLVRIGPDEIGVRTNNLSLGQRGVVPEDYGPGWHLNLPLAHTWYIFPARIRRLELTKDPRQRSELGAEALMVKSSDGDRVLLDINLFFRIQPGQAHRLLQDTGADDGHVRVLRGIASDHLRAIFGTLHTEEFYDPLKREEKTRQSHIALRKALTKRFIDLVDIQVQDVEFEPKYEQKIKDKKLADQNVELNKAQMKAASARGKVTAIQIETSKRVNLIDAEAAAESERILAEAGKNVARLRGEADRYAEEQRAHGTLLIAQAGAKVKREKTRALVTSGGANLAALEAVKNIKIKSISFPTGGSDWFDVREMAGRLGAQR